MTLKIVFFCFATYSNKIHSCDISLMFANIIYYVITSISSAILLSKSVYLHAISNNPIFIDQ